MMLRLSLVAILIASSAALFGCAVASEDVGATPGRPSRDGGSVDPNDEDTGDLEDTGSPQIDTGTSQTDSGAPSDSGGTDTGPAETGTPCTVVTATECASSATILTSVSGDTGGTATASGTDSQFLRVRVTEDDSSVFGAKDLKVRVTLTSTSGNFDLYVYAGADEGDGGGIECSTPTGSSSNATGDDVVATGWTDSQGLGGFSNTRWLSIEVRAADPSCDGASWSLTVEGNK